MTIEEKELLLREIDNYNGSHLFELLALLNDEIKIKKILIQNEYGIIGNILYKYKNDIDNDIKAAIFLKDFMQKEYNEYLSDDCIDEEIKRIKRIAEDIRNGLIDDREWVLKILKLNTYIFYFLNKTFKNDKEIVLAAVKRDSELLSCVSNELKRDKEFILEAVKNNWKSLRYASLNLKNDKDLLLEAVRQCGNFLEYLSERFKNDRDIVMTAVKKIVLHYNTLVMI